MILGKLRQATSDQHKALEKLLYQEKILNYSLSVAEFKELLLINLLAHAHLEEALEKGLSQNEKNVLDLGKRKKTDWLLKDLLQQGIDGEKFLKETQPTSQLIVGNLQEALGVLYVSEGATLGGKFILRKMVLNPTLKFISDFTFFRGYEGDTGEYWREIQELLNQEEKEDADYSIIIDKAVETFGFFISIVEDLQKKRTAMKMMSKCAEKELGNR